MLNNDITGSQVWLGLAEVVARMRRRMIISRVLLLLGRRVGLRRPSQGGSLSPPPQVATPLPLPLQ